MKHFPAIVISVLLAGLGLGVAGFGTLGLQGKLSRKPPTELFPDMDRQAKLRPQEPNRFFASGVSSQLPPAGTVARGEPIQTASGAVYRFEDSPVNTGHLAGSTNFVENNPLPVSEAWLQRGRDRFDIYCAACHGKIGDGNGIMKKLAAMPTVANLHDPRIVKMTDGDIFNTVTYGKGTMGPVGPLIQAEDRWAVIAYLRVLQLSRLGTLDDLTAAEKAGLKK